MTAAVTLAALEKKALATRIGRIALVVIAAIALFVLGRCSSPAPTTPLPPSLAAQLKSYDIIAGADTARAHAAEAQRDTAKLQEAIAVQHADMALAAANLEHARADSIARAAAESHTLADSAARLWAALGALRAENLALRDAIKSDSAALRNADKSTLFAARADTAETDVSDRAQGVIDHAVSVIKASEPPCHVAHFFGCPSRKTALIIGTASGIAFVEAPKIAKALGFSLSIKL